MQFSRGYLRAGYVSIEAPGAELKEAAKRTVAATYASPAQLIAVQQHDVTLDLENTSASTVEAVANGRAQRAIVWYPAVVAYRMAHPERSFTVATARLAVCGLATDLRVRRKDRRIAPAHRRCAHVDDQRWPPAGADETMGLAFANRFGNALSRQAIERIVRAYGHHARGCQRSARRPLHQGRE